jgi:hypothetical protein
MFRFTFKVFYTDADGSEKQSTMQVTQDSDDVNTARAQVVYLLSRMNGKVFAPFTFEPTKIEERVSGQWIKILEVN